MLLELGELRRQTQALASRAQRALRAASGEGDEAPEALRILARETRELSTRVGRLEGEASGVVAPLTDEQQSTLEAAKADSSPSLGYAYGAYRLALVELALSAPEQAIVQLIRALRSAEVGREPALLRSARAE